MIDTLRRHTEDGCPKKEEFSTFQASKTMSVPWYAPELEVKESSQCGIRWCVPPESISWDVITPEPDNSHSNARDVSRREVSSPNLGSAQLSKSSNSVSKNNFRVPQELVSSREFGQKRLPLNEPMAEQYSISQTKEISVYDNDISKAVNMSGHGTEQTSDESNSSCSEGSRSQSTEDEVQLALLNSRHHALSRLMREVYIIFDQRWTANVQDHTPSNTNNTPLERQTSTTTGHEKSYQNQKRRRNDRETSPPGDGHKRRKPNCQTTPSPEAEKQLLACPFHKNSPRKFCCNGITGSKYRACVGPGFANIARLK